MEDMFVPSESETLAGQDEKLWGMLSHLSTFLGGAFPIANIIAPLILMSYYQDKSEFVSNHAKEALNFQISLVLYYFIAGLLAFVFIGFLFIPIIFIGSIILTIKAALDANKGERVSYPFSIRFIK